MKNGTRKGAVDVYLISRKYSFQDTISGRTVRNHHRTPISHLASNIQFGRIFNIAYCFSFVNNKKDCP